MGMWKETRFLARFSRQTADLVEKPGFLELAMWKETRFLARFSRQTADLVEKPGFLETVDTK